MSVTALAAPPALAASSPADEALLVLVLSAARPADGPAAGRPGTRPEVYRRQRPSPPLTHGE